jgi:hypothetical protein
MHFAVGFVEAAVFRADDFFATSNQMDAMDTTNKT